MIRTPPIFTPTVTLFPSTTRFRSHARGGKDDLSGVAGPDDLYAGAGNDTVVGREGNDRIYGNTDSDMLFGEEGNDTINSAGDGERDVVKCGQGEADKIG